MTPAWKDAVRAALKNNKLGGKEPSDQSQLARAIGVHKTAITNMWKAASSVCVDPICKVLGLAAPMGAVDPDGELAKVVIGLEPAQQKTLLEFAQFLLEKRSKKDS